MTEPRKDADHRDSLTDDEIASVYGSAVDEDPAATTIAQTGRKFQPWHHPVKQIVRDRQWAALTKRLLAESRPAKPEVLRYFTLPGPDLLDVQVLADVCSPHGIKIDYFGFDAGADDIGDPNGQGAEATTTESALRQAGRVADSALIMPDRLEDIARADSQAAESLRRQLPFDVINIDGCDHLAYTPKDRQFSTFDALRALLSHQMEARLPWLLFITTRATPELIGDPGIHMQAAISANLKVARESFGEALAEAIEAEPHLLAAALTQCWGKHDIKFLKLYCIGLGKFLLQFFHGQPNHPAKVELASAYAYRVHAQTPDMLALAFRITPDERRIFDPAVGGAAVIPNLEPARALQVADKANKLVDIDDALEHEEDTRTAAVKQTMQLLGATGYDLRDWIEWLSKHERRPMLLDGNSLLANMV